jgi:hypothetical protein
MRVILGFIAASTMACAPDFDGTRAEDTHTFGERVVTLMCKRIAFEANPMDVSGATYRDACDGGDPPTAADTPPTLVALFANRASLVKSIDTAVTADDTTDLQAFLTSDATLALYDDDTMAKSIVNVADLLDDIARDGAAVSALARTGTRIGYRPPAAELGMPAALVTARRAPSGGMAAGMVIPSVHEVMSTTIPAITPGGPANAEWDALTAALAATLLDASAPSDAASPSRTAALAADLFLTERSDLVEPVALPLVRRDPRGIAHVALAGTAVPAPFVDLDHDQLADVDALGRFVDAQGQVLAMAAPFTVAGDTATRDAAGRIAAFDYVALDKTVIGALGHDAAQLFDPAKGTALDLARGASALLGPRVMTTKTFDGGGTLSYQGYDLTQSPLLDMLYGWSQLLRDPHAPDLLGLADTLLANHTPATARLIEAAIATSRLGDAHPEAQIVASAPMWDDMMPVLRQILAKPALVTALTQALQQPETKALAQRFSDLMSYTDRFDINQTTQAVTGSFTTKVDRTKVDNGFDRSVFQRFLHLLNDSNHAQVCNKPDGHVKVGPVQYPLIGGYNACELIELDNIATLFVEAIAYAKDASGNIVCENAAGSTVACTASGARPRPASSMTFKDGVVNTAIDLLGGDAFLESQSGITGFRRHPTPEALTRVLFLNPLPAFLTPSLDPVRDRDGDLYNTTHLGTLPVLEKNNFFNEFRPIAQAFVDNGSEQLLVDLMSAMHKHWPSPNSTSTQSTNPAGADYALGSNGVSWEPLIIDALAGDLVPALVDTAPELNAITVNGKPYATVVNNAGAFLLDPLAGLTDRQGRTTSLTSDGKPVAQLSPWQLLADAYVAKQARIAEMGGEGAAWTSSVRATVDLMFRADHDASAGAAAGWTFHNGHVPAVSRAAVALVLGRLTAHAADVPGWVSTTLRDDARDLLTHPVFAALADLTVALTAQAGPRLALEALLHDAFDETTSPDVFAMLRTASADLIQLLSDDQDLVPIAHLAGRLLASDKLYLPTQLDLLQKLNAADQSSILVRITSQLFSSYDANDPGVPSIAAIVDGSGEIDRQMPSADRPAWTADDVSTVLTNVASFLRDQQRGMLRFITIVQGRNP